LKLVKTAVGDYVECIMMKRRWFGDHLLLKPTAVVISELLKYQNTGWRRSRNAWSNVQWLSWRGNQR